MKRFLSLMLAVLLLLGTVPGAMAETAIDPLEKRGIKVKKVGLNDVEEGISPTTGLPLADYDLPAGFAGLAATGRYLPMLVQIDNGNGGIGNMAPWGASYADIIYESPLHSNGATRMSYLFSDLIPTSVGPVRSARVGHAWLREEWDAGFLFYGGQQRKGSNINEEFKKYGANKKGVLFSGIVGSGRPWKKYYTRRSGGAPSPHNVDANVAAISELVPETHVAPNHAFKFTDELPTGDPAAEVIINWSHLGYGSNLIYDADSNVYFRYMRTKDEEIPYEDRDSQEQLSFANVIVQFANVTYNGSSAAPVTHHVGEGNADYFMGGVHIRGYWKREDMSSRTVYYKADGTELEMQRGKTLIIVFPDKILNKKMKSMGVSYE